MKTMKFPKEYSLKVDVTKVNWEIMKEWSAQRVTQLLGMEDEVVIGYIHEQLGTDKKVSQASHDAYEALPAAVVTCRPALVVQDLDPRQLQIALTGFLEKNTSLFVKVCASRMLNAVSQLFTAVATSDDRCSPATWPAKCKPKCFMHASCFICAL